MPAHCRMQCVITSSLDTDGRYGHDGLYGHHRHINNTSARLPFNFRGLSCGRAFFLFLPERKAASGLVSSLHAVVLVRNGELLSSLGAACCQHSAAIGCSHSFTESVLVLSLSVRGLECSFHLFIFFTLLFAENQGAKIDTFCKTTKHGFFLSQRFCVFSWFAVPLPHLLRHSPYAVLGRRMYVFVFLKHNKDKKV